MPTAKRLISLVPSWTETLIATGELVVGRTRFCIHPAEDVAKIPTVGGTKDVKWEKVERMAPDLLILDREENTREIAEQSPCPVFASHVRSIADAGRDMDTLATTLDSPALRQIAGRWRTVCQRPNRQIDHWEQIPGVLRWIRKPAVEIETILYMIWRDPWMTVSSDTFIGSVLERTGVLGLSSRGTNNIEGSGQRDRYPEVDLSQCSPESTLLLLSTEPYPFHKRIKEFETLPFPSAIVDGEAFSWFGIRTLEFLERLDREEES